MRNTNSKSILGRTAAAGALLLGAAFAGQAAMACTLDNWSYSEGAVSAGDPFAESIPRYSGFCGMEATGVGYVQDNNPNGIPRIVARFYVLKPSTGAVEVYAGYGDAGDLDQPGGSTPASDKLFSVTVDSSGLVTLTDTTISTSVDDTATTNWISIEIDWVQDSGSGNGELNLTVNGQTEQEALSLSNSSANDLAAVQLGNLGGASGARVVFDAYESRRSTGVGRLVSGDANNDGAVTVFDAIAVVNESAGPATGTLAVGQPDCNEDGAVTVFDAICAVNVAAGP